MKEIWYTVQVNGKVSYYKSEETLDLAVEYEDMDQSRFLYDLNKKINEFKQSDNEIERELNENYNSLGQSVTIERIGFYRKVTFQKK